MPVNKRRRVGEHPAITRALSNTKGTALYVHMLRKHTVKSARCMVRAMGETKWYAMKKNSLVSIIVLDILVRRLQRFFKTKGGDVKAREKLFQDSKNEVCPITLTPILELPIRDRYWNSNYCFDRKSLSEFLRGSCDFVHPVTRIEFTIHDVMEIDESLGDLFENREQIRSSLVSRMENIQCVENELEDIFIQMIDVACLAQTRREFNVVMTYSEVQFEECFNDLLRMDRGRCIIALKSLPDLLQRNTPSLFGISRRRERELKELVNEFLFRADPHHMI